MEPKIRFKGFEEEWKEERLSEISSSIASGKNIDHKGPYPLYGSTGIIGTTDKPYHEGPMLLVARVGANAGFLQLVNEKCGVSDNTLIVKPKDPVTDNYLFQYFKFFNLNRFIYGSGQPLITGGMLKKMPVRYGLKEERETLIDYFTSLDSQISASTSRLASLKQMKAASLQAMFPQEGETVPKIRFKGFEGEWKKVKFSELYERSSIKNDLSFGTDKIISVANMYFIKNSRQVDDDYLRSYNIMRLGDIAFEGNKSKNFAHGRLVENTIGDGIVSHVFIVMKPISKNYDLNFWKYYINNENIMGNILVRSTKSSTMMTDLVVDDFLKESILVPSYEEQIEIGKILTSLDRQISLQSQRLEKLKQIKSACLDKMFV